MATSLSVNEDGLTKFESGKVFHMPSENKRYDILFSLKAWMYYKVKFSNSTYYK